MFWSKRYKRNLPEEMKESKINTEAEIMHINNGDIDHITEAISKALVNRTDPLVRFIVNKIKTDKKFFDEFITSLEKGEYKHDVVRDIVKNKFIESCKKIFS